MSYRTPGDEFVYRGETFKVEESSGCVEVISLDGEWGAVGVNISPSATLNSRFGYNAYNRGRITKDGIGRASWGTSSTQEEARKGLLSQLIRNKHERERHEAFGAKEREQSCKELHGGEWPSDGS